MVCLPERKRARAEDAEMASCQRVLDFAEHLDCIQAGANHIVLWWRGGLVSTGIVSYIFLRSHNARTRLAEPEGLDADGTQITQALARIRDRFARYFVAMFVEIIADRISD
jgi:hypothetical protein